MPTCPYPSLAEDAQPIAGSLTFYHINMIVAGACTGFALLSTFTLMYQHATHLSRYEEQAKIIKICFLIPVYSVLCYLSIVFPDMYVYLDPWTDYAESIAIASFFLLLCEYVSPFDQQRDMFFAALQVKNARGKKTDENGLRWFRRRWILIFQYPFVALASAIATDITQAYGKYCLWTSVAGFAHLWIELVDSISVSLAVLGVVQMYVNLRHHIADHKPLAKLFAFKAIVFLAFIQSIIFWGLRDENIIQPSATLTYADLFIGIPELLLCAEMAILSVFFHYAYSYKPYVIDHASGSKVTYQGGFLGWRLFVAIFDPREILDAQAFAFQIATKSKEIEENPTWAYANQHQLKTLPSNNA